MILVVLHFLNKPGYYVQHKTFAMEVIFPGCEVIGLSWKLGSEETNLKIVPNVPTVDSCSYFLYCLLNIRYSRNMENSSNLFCDLRIKENAVKTE